ncbi:MAG TPA: TIGR03086 family metal-binding protein, partial [Candidatus Nanoarchaeia archaeon]|nr:TIGR03086 family metal-binding protein [Candidatus Nanoarchaeia archaeon]
MNTAELHKKASDHISELVSNVKDDQWGAATPCADWTVKDLLNHVTYENVWVKPLVSGQTIDEVGDKFEGDLLGADPKSAWLAAASESEAAFAEPGALDRTVKLSRGDTPGSDYAAEVFMDLLIHSWDLARGLGVDEHLDPELVEACYKILEPQAEAWRSGG